MRNRAQLNANLIATRRRVGIWLGDQDLNLGCPGQSREFYR